MQFPAYFVNNNSLYKLNPLFDPYDISRNALTTTSFYPGVYHPPCRLFSKLRHFAKADPSEKDLAFWSLERVRKFGGILEHPVDSSFWYLSRIVAPGFMDSFGGFTVVINQSDFGFPAIKRTRLYIVGLHFTQLPIFTPFIVPFRRFSDLSPSQRSLTTIHLQSWFFEILNLIWANRLADNFSSLKSSLQHPVFNYSFSSLKHRNLQLTNNSLFNYPKLF